MKAQLQNHSLSSHEPCPLFPLGFSPFYNNALILFSWAFIWIHLETFDPLSHIWASSYKPCPLFYLGFSPFYNNALILFLWAFIRMHLKIFDHLSQIWAYNVFITFGLFFLYFIIITFWSTNLARIHCSISLKVHGLFIIWA